MKLFVKFENIFIDFYRCDRAIFLTPVTRGVTHFVVKINKFIINYLIDL